MSLLEQDTTRIEQVTKNHKIISEPKFEAGGDKKYKIDAI